MDKNACQKCKCKYSSLPSLLTYCLCWKRFRQALVYNNFKSLSYWAFHIDHCWEWPEWPCSFLQNVSSWQIYSRDTDVDASLWAIIKQRSSAKHKTSTMTSSHSCELYYKAHLLLHSCELSDLGALFFSTFLYNVKYFSIFIYTFWTDCQIHWHVNVFRVAFFPISGWISSRNAGFLPQSG